MKNMVSKITNKIIALFFILLFLPMWIIVFIILKILYPKRSAIYKAQRYGKDMKLFSMYKFSTMIPGKRIIDPNNPLLHSDNDHRITKFGKFLRKFSIDETLQLINVLKGDMFIIGPRPCEYEEIKLFPKERFYIYPGISGVVCRWKKKQPSMKEIYDAELYFATHYGFKVKFKAMLNGIMLLWRNK